MSPLQMCYKKVEKSFNNLQNLHVKVTALG